MNDLGELKTQIFDGMDKMANAAAERMGKIEKELKAEKSERETLEAKMNRFNLGGSVATQPGINAADLAAEHKALGIFVRSELRAAINCPELKAMSTGSDPDGGYMVTPARSAALTKRLFDESPMRRLSRLETMTTGDVFEEVLDLEEAAAAWVGETEARPATTTPRIGLLSVPLCEEYAEPVVTQKLIDTSYIDIGAWIDGKVNDKFARADGTAFVSGTGVRSPRGFLSYNTSTDSDFVRPFGMLQYVKTGASGGFDPTNPGDVLRKCMWSLRAPYRRNANWLMNSNTASLIDQFKDLTGNYYWRPATTAGVPPTMLGYPVEIDENMPDVNAGAFPIAFGNFQLGYLIVERPGLKMLQDPFTNKPNVNFYAYRRVGGGLQNSDCIKLIKCAE